MKKQADKKNFSLEIEATIAILSVIFFISPLFESVNVFDSELTIHFIITSIIIIFCFVCFFYHYSKYKNSANRILYSPISVCFLLFILISLLSIFWSINKGDAFFELVKKILFYSLFVLFGILMIKNKKTLSILCRILSFSALLYIIIATIQLYHLSNKFNASLIIDYRISSTLFNKNIFAEVLFLLLPFLIYSTVIEIRYWKYFSLFALLITFITIILLQSFAVWIALFVCIIVGIHFLIQEKKFKINKSITFISIILLSFLVISKSSSFFNPIFYKIDTILKYSSDLKEINDLKSHANNNSIHDRFMILGNSIEMIKEHPFGVGLANWKILVSKYGIYGTDFLNSGIVRFQNPENDFVYVWSELGIIGALAFLLIITIVIKATLTDIKNKENKFKNFSLYILFGMIGYIIFSLFSFPNDRISTMSIIMFYYAFISSNSNLKEYKSIIAPKKYLTICLVSILLLSNGIGAYTGYKRYLGEMHLKHALIEKGNKKWNDVVREINKSYSFFYTIDYVSTPLYWYRGVANYNLGKLNEAKKDFLLAEKTNPYHLQLLNDIGSLYEIENKHNKAIYYYKKALNISPQYDQAILNLASALYNSGKYVEAKKTIIRYSNKSWQEYIFTRNAIFAK